MEMRVSAKATVLTVVLLLGAQAPTHAAGLESGTVNLTSGGPLAFAPEGVLLVSDPMAATIYAVETGDTQGNPNTVEIHVDDLRGKLAGLLGTTRQDVQVNDVAVNPLSGKVYLCVTRGSGRDAATVIFRVNEQGDIAEVPLENVNCASATLPNPPASAADRRGNPRTQTITDIVYFDGRVFIAGLSNEEFASKLRAIPYPFETSDNGTSVEIFHGAHGQIETRSPIMTFAPYEIEGEPHVLAAYTCTPLVKFRVADLEPGTKVRGITVAELGNRNRPLDMFVYSKGGKDYILMANSSRGVMKISTDNVGDARPITQHVPDGNRAGLPYETIETLKGVIQLARLNDQHAVVLVSGEDGQEDLTTIPLP